MTTKKQEKQLRGLLQGMGASGEPKRRAARKAKAEPADAKPAKASASEIGPGEETIQISAYLPKTLHRRLKIALASQDEKLTLTDLLIKLLTDWTKREQ